MIGCGQRAAGVWAIRRAVLRSRDRSGRHQGDWSASRRGRRASARMPHSALRSARAATARRDRSGGSRTAHLPARVGRCGCCGSSLLALTGNPHRDGTLIRRHVCSSHYHGRFTRRCSTGDAPRPRSRKRRVRARGTAPPGGARDSRRQWPRSPTGWPRVAAWVRAGRRSARGQRQCRHRPASRRADRRWA